VNIFKVNVDITVYIISLVVVLLLILPIIDTIFYKNPIASNPLVVFIPIGVLVITLLFAPTSYVITKDQIFIKKVCGSIKLNKADIIDIAPPMSNDLKSSIRTFASGGLFGYFGKYKSPKLGNYNMYAGSMKANNLLVIRMRDGNKYVISPKRIDEFLLYAKNT